MSNGALELYLSEIFGSPFDDFQDICKMTRYYHNDNADCECQDCIEWFGSKYKKYVIYRLPFSKETVILTDVKFVHINLISRPWKRCNCDHCVKLCKTEKFTYSTEIGNLTMGDVQSIKDTISSFECSAILPLDSPPEHMMRCFELSSYIEIKMDTQDDELFLTIRTTSIDGMNISLDPLHEFDSKLPKFRLKMNQSDLVTEDRKPNQRTEGFLIPDKRKW
jgi:hypothetical protein